MSSSSSNASKRAREQKEEAAQPSPRELLKQALNTLVPNRHETPYLVTNINASRTWYAHGGLWSVDCSRVPTHYLPDRFQLQRRIGGDRIIFDGKYPLGERSTAELVACIKATAVGASAYYMDDEYRALVVGRSSSSPLGQHFEAYTVKRTEGDPGLYDLLGALAPILASCKPSAKSLEQLIHLIRDIHRSKSSQSIALVVQGLNSQTLIASLSHLLDSTAKHVGVFASVLLGCILTEESLEAVLLMGVAGSLTIDQLFRIMSTTSIQLPVTSFPVNRGLDTHGNPLEAVKLSSCQPDDEVLTHRKVVTFPSFRAFNKESLVFVTPARGLYKRGPKKGKVWTYIEMEHPSMAASDLTRLAAAVEGSSGNVHQEEKKDEEDDERFDELEEETEI